MRLPKSFIPAALLAHAITTAENNAQPRNTTAKPSADLFIDATAYPEQPLPSATSVPIIMRLENYSTDTTRYTWWKDDNSRKAKPFTYSPKKNQRQRRRDSRRRN